jgi:hypothetical protein
MCLLWIYFLYRGKCMCLLRVHFLYSDMYLSSAFTSCTTTCMCLLCLHFLYRAKCMCRLCLHFLYVPNVSRIATIAWLTDTSTFSVEGSRLVILYNTKLPKRTDWQLSKYTIIIIPNVMPKSTSCVKNRGRLNVVETCCVNEYLIYQVLVMFEWTLYIYDIFTWNLWGNNRLVKVHNKGVRNLYTSLNIKPVRLSEIKAEITVAYVARRHGACTEFWHTRSQKLCRENTTYKS